MKQKITLQVGAEVFVGGKRQVRLTPIDQSFQEEVSPGFVNGLALLIGFVDKIDSQPGDGEVDIPVPIEKLRTLGPLAGLIPEGAKSNAFIRINFAPAQGAKP